MILAAIFPFYNPQEHLTKTNRLEGLDSLRGVAILLVVAFHVSIPFKTTGLFAQILSSGNSGVQLFFLISAITMCYMWGKRKDEFAPTRKFYIRRGFRIAPAFWFAIIFYTCTRVFSSRGMVNIDALDIGLTTFFLHGFSVHAINLVVPGGWSIAVEMSFYVIFPFLVMRFRTPLQRVVLAFVIYLVCIGLTTLVKPYLSGGNVENFLYYSMLTQLPIFPLGMALYAVVMAKEKIDWRPTLAIGIAWLAIGFGGKELGLLSRPFFWIQVFSFMGLIALVLAKNITWKPLEWIGRLSYSMYLFHFAVIDFVFMPLAGKFLTGIPDYLCGLAGTILVTSGIAWISGRTLEAWSSGWARKCIDLLKPAAAKV
jgi:exopolysaccharide production protein ExoZ